MSLSSVSFLEIACAECGNRSVLDPNCFTEEISGSSRERGMGYECEYIYSLETKCAMCGNELWVRYGVLEYPMGAIDSYYDYSRGCTVVSYPQVMMWFNYEEDDGGIINYAVQGDYSKLQEIIDDPEKLYNVNDRDFEVLVADVFKGLGYEVKLTKQTRDGGYDVIATKCIDGLTYMIIIECKHFRPNHKVNVSLIRQLSAVRDDNKANKALLVTSSFFTRDAQEYANGNNSLIELIDVNQLIELIKKAENK